MTIASKTGDLRSMSFAILFTPNDVKYCHTLILFLALIDGSTGFAKKSGLAIFPVNVPKWERSDPLECGNGHILA
jgi:hypothetical protein